MVRNITYKPEISNISVKKSATQNTNKLNNLHQDTISFSAKKKPPLSTYATEKEIKARIKSFEKIMDGDPIPAEVMKVLKNPEVVVSVPSEKADAAGVGIIRRCLKSIIETILPKSVADKLIPKISPKVLQDFKVVSARLDKVKILDKSEGPFGGNGEVYFISLITDGVSEPALLRVETFKNIKDGDDLCDKGLQKPFTLYLSEEGKLPRLLDMRLLIMEEDQKGAQKAGEIIDAITGNKEYQEIIKAIRILISQAAPPVAIFTLIDSAMGIIKKVLQCNEDDQLLYYAARFTKDFDNLGVGKYDKKYDKVELGYEIVAK